MRRLIAAGAGAGLVLLVSGCQWDVAKNTTTDDATVDAKVSTVWLSTAAGDVKIRKGNTTTVHRTVHYDKDKPGATHKVDGNVLVLEECPVHNCWIDYEVTVPAGTKVDGDVASGAVELTGLGAVNLKAASGDVTVRGASGPVNLDVSSGATRLSDIGAAVAVQAASGEVTVDNAKGNVTVAAESGGVHAKGVGGAVDVRSHSGDVDVALTAAQNVTARADSGAVNVTVPRSGYRVLTGTDSGDVHSDVPNDPSGRHTLDLHTESGDITISFG